MNGAGGPPAALPPARVNGRGRPAPAGPAQPPPSPAGPPERRESPAATGPMPPVSPAGPATGARPVPVPPAEARTGTLPPPGGTPSRSLPPGIAAAESRPSEHAADPVDTDGARTGGSVLAARAELRRQLREHKRIRAMALTTVVLVVLGAPMLYFGILFATRDPVLNSLDRLDVPSWAARSPEDRIISGSRWCFIDCRFRERLLDSERGTEDTTAVYQAALADAGWSRWQVEGCPQVEVDGDYTCWTRDEYTLDLWVHPPECAYDPLNQRPDVTGPEAESESESGSESGSEDAAETEQAQVTPAPVPPPAADCTGSVVEIKMQNRVADERGLTGTGGPPAPPPPTAPPTGTAPATPSTEPSAPTG